jgi:chemotaxis protein methyltransferase CheR
LLLESVSITDDEFLLFKKLTYGLLGINLSEQKRALVVSRLSSRIRDLNLSTFMDYLVYLNKNDANALSELTIFINKITTNETFFFREKHHFDVLVNELFLKKNHSSILRIWSAGCSSGEEP